MRSNILWTCMNGWIMITYVRIIKITGNKMILDIKEYVSEDAILLEPRERYDHCIIGATYDGDRIIYDAIKIIEVLIEDDEMTEGDAVEYFEYNIHGAYLGEHTPVYAGVVLF